MVKRKNEISESNLFYFFFLFQSWKLFGRKLFGPCVNFGNFMAGNFLGGNFLAGNFLSYVVIFGNFMAGNFLGGNFLGRIHLKCMILIICTIYISYDEERKGKERWRERVYVCE